MSTTHADHSSHDHSHAHIPATGNIATAFFLNTGFALIEVVGGLLTNSVAILSDALHDFGDSISLGAAWYFQRKSGHKRSSDYTYGYQWFSLLGAFINSMVLIAGSIFIIRESIERLISPERANYTGMLILAILGVVINGTAMLRLKKGQSINEKVVSLHFLEDVLGWVAVLIGSIIMLFVDIPILDPILSLSIAAFVLFNVYRTIKPAIRIILQAAPGNISEEEIRSLIMNEPGISNVHNFRLWTLDGTHHVVSMHVVVNNNTDLKATERLKDNINKRLNEVHIMHATIEVEYKPEHPMEE